MMSGIGPGGVKAAAWLAAMLGIAATNPAWADAPKKGCYKDWQSAQAAVREHHLSRVDQLSVAAQRVGLGQIVKAMLCRDGDRFEYRVIVRDRSGQLKRRVTGAKSPFATHKGAQKKHHRGRRGSRR